MSVLTMTAPEAAPETRSPRYRRDATPQEIIDQARAAPAPMIGALAVSCLSALLLWASFTPLDYGPLGWVAIIPLLLLIRVERPTRRMYLATYLAGLLFWIPTLQWMRLGHPAMYGAWLALSVYLAFYFPVFVGLTRVAVWRLRIPMILAAPVVWVGLEVLRSRLITGFGWYYLGHSQHRWIELIQLSDLVGAYGVSGLMALTATAAAELIPESLLAWCRLIPGASSIEIIAPRSHSGRWRRAGVALAMLGLALGYGYWRRSQAEFAPGPRVALVQGNVTTEVKHDPNDWPRIQKRHEMLTGLAVKQQPDIIIWPETMFRWPLFSLTNGATIEEVKQAHPQWPFDRLQDPTVRKRLVDLSQMSGCAMVMGIEAIDADREHVRIYNSAALIRPDMGLAARYDKLHRVIFGEYIPLVEWLPFLQRLTPFPEGFGVAAGAHPVAFDYKGYRFAPIICYEDTVPHLVRNVINSTRPPSESGKTKIDFLVNLSNDGWFHGSSELDQHLITAAFRCVEFRTPLVRAVNTGISAFIDGDGVIRKRATDINDLTSHASKQVEAVVVDAVPLDHRDSLYLRYGDWFGGLCLAGCIALCVTGVFGRWLPRRVASQS